MALFKSKNVFRISPTDGKDGFLANKIAGGENVEVSVENSAAFGERLVITTNKTQNRKVKNLTESGEVASDEYLVLIDASQNHVVVTLPPAKDYLGQLHLVCLDASKGIELKTSESCNNTILDVSNVSFVAKGDSITLVSDRGEYIPPFTNEDEEVTAQSVHGTWFVVGRYNATWYA